MDRLRDPRDRDEPPPEPDKKNELLVKAYLPYKVNFGLDVLEAARTRGSSPATVATLDWRPSVNHALISRLTPVLPPLFRSNNNWSLRRGERQIRELLGVADEERLAKWLSAACGLPATHRRRGRTDQE